MKNKKGRRIFLIVLLAVVGLVGGSFIAVLIYLQAKGLLETVIQALFGYFSLSASSVLVLFWVLIFPVLLFIFLLFTFIRKQKIDKKQSAWEEGMKIAIEAERAIAKQNEKLPARFGITNEIGFNGNFSTAEGNRISSLKELCERFRLFAAGNLNLYFGVDEVREFIAGLGASRILILQGISGAGKTSLAYAFGEFIGNPSTIIPVQPMWKERADILGYYNEFKKKFNETILFKKLYEADFSDQMFITVLDEMNIARVEYYFAEFLSLLEIPNPDLRYIEIVPDKWENDPVGLKDGCLKLPTNMWFIGTVNDDDSAFSISDKVYDRAMVVNLASKAKRVDGILKQETVSLPFEQWQEFISDAQRAYVFSEKTEKGLQAFEDFLVEKFQITYGNRIRRQINDYIAVYVACGGGETEALDDILSKKVLRKLQYRDLMNYRKELEDLKRFLDETFGKNKMQRCLNFIKNLSGENRVI